MELIYKSASGGGLMDGYSFDLAYGDSENDFELKLPLSAHKCEPDDYVYMIDESLGLEDGTEYGGIVDGITIDTERQEVIYTGRTWHGVLASKTIEPPAGFDYYSVSGNALDIIGDLISQLGLSNYVHTSGTSDVEIAKYEFPRYCDFYSGISEMVAQSGGKLKLWFDGTYIQISVVWAVDYGIAESMDMRNVTLKASRMENNVNHLICLGDGDLHNRHVIHLFTDGAGNIQPYTTVNPPETDADYILDKRNQVLFTINEVSEVFDYPSAMAQDNYQNVTVQPDDWADSYDQYFTQDEDGAYHQVARERSDYSYTVLSSKPADWDTKYSRYYTANHKTVEGVDSISYAELTSQPGDWDTRYGNYYTDVGGVKTAVSGETAYVYDEQKKEPSDWETQYQSYYQRVVITTSVQDVSGSSAMSGDYYVMKSTGNGFIHVVPESGEAPKWRSSAYFTRRQITKAPDFLEATRYKRVVTVVSPAWQADRYYTRTTAGENVPVFKVGTYYRKVVDHYANLVRNGLRRLNEIWDDAESVKMNLDLNNEYDIGDIVGTEDETTGLSVWKPIVKKIVSINKYGKKVDYKVGG